jgi:hypothetical protein
MENLVRTVLQAQNEFTDFGKTPQVSHYTEIDFSSDNRTSIGSSTFMEDLYSVGSQGRKSVTATMRYSYEYRARPPVEAFMKYWGLHMTGEVLWNMIPLSFLLDYFVKIGQSLHAMDVDKNVDVTRHEYSESRLVHYTDGVYTSDTDDIVALVINGQYYGQGFTAGRFLAGTERKSYKRVVCQPSMGTYIPIVRSKVSSGHWLNMAALARCFM